MKPTLVVLAAGMGSRYGGIKQIEPVGPHQAIILEYSVFDAVRAGFGAVVFVIRRDIAADFQSSILARLADVIPITIVFQDLSDLPAGCLMPSNRTKPWGTAHAVLCAQSAIATPFAIVNADDFYGADAYRVMAAYLAERSNGEANFAMVGYALKNTVSEFGSVSRGLCQVDDQDWLTSVVEHTKIESTPTGIVSHLPAGGLLACSGDETVSMNLFGFTPKLFDHLETLFKQFLNDSASDPKAEFYVPGVVNQLIQTQTARLKVLKSVASWFGITYKQDLPSTVDSIRRLVAAGEYPERLWKH
jgi:UTP-glucose-1-phosphate uridylyltransferase